jgi:hypothetical protein
MLRLLPENRYGAPLAPLAEVTVTGAAGGALAVRDGRDREYVRAPAADPFTFAVSGALGTHSVLHEDDEGRILDRIGFAVDCRTELTESDGRYAELLDMLYWTMVGRWGEVSTFRHGGKVYKFFVGWLRDHVHTLKGMKYFYPDLKSGIELYADTQRADGMVWDKIGDEPSLRPTHRDHWFGPGGFVRKADDGSRRMERIPVENDVEYLFVEGLYYTWKANGDTAWMAGLLDNALKALRYSVTDPYRWSGKYGLLKRGFTIDTWDFQADEDAAITGYTMVVDKDRTRFGVMHGDNTGFAAACRYLAEMLNAAGRHDEARQQRELAGEIKERLDKVAWNGEFYTHHVPEDPAVVRDLGVDQSRQVSLSNAYALNRGIDHDQCVAIVRTYRRIREEMPPTSPGEFYQIFPPFERGFGGHGDKWHYMNGGVTTIVAGELSHGAFEHGFEQYGADILNRVHGWGRAHGGYLHCTYRGAMPEPPVRTFEPVDLTGLANADLSGEGAGGVPGWTSEGENDLANMPVGSQRWHDVPFEVIDPAQNGRRAVIAVSSRDGYLAECSIPVGRRTASIWLLHTAAGENPVGILEWRYADGTRESEYIMKGRHLDGWWLPREPRAGRGHGPAARVAWWGPNAVFPNVGTYVCGMDNPRPDREVSELVLRAAENGSFWMVLGITLCDAPAFFMPDDLSFGIPDNWGAAAVLYALLEGLAGVKDTGVAFDSALLAPRWEAAGVAEAEATVRYRASDGYLAYRYARDDDVIHVDAAGTAQETDLRVLLPQGREASSVSVDGESVEWERVTVESSVYAAVPLSGPAARSVEVRLKPEGE